MIIARGLEAGGQEHVAVCSTEEKAMRFLRGRRLYGVGYKATIDAEVPDG